MRTFLLTVFSFLALIAKAQNNTPWSITDNIGIGTESPQFKLDVNGKMRISWTTDDYALRLEGHSLFNGTIQQRNFPGVTYTNLSFDIDGTVKGRLEHGSNSFRYFSATANKYLLDVYGSSTEAYVKVGNNATVHTAGGAFEIESTTGGLLLPRMTQAQRTAIPVTIESSGLLLYQNDAQAGFYGLSNNTWKKVLQENDGNYIENRLASSAQSEATMWIRKSLSSGDYVQFRVDTSGIEWKHETGGMKMKGNSIGRMYWTPIGAQYLGGNWYLDGASSGRMILTSGAYIETQNGAPIVSGQDINLKAYGATSELSFYTNGGTAAAAIRRGYFLSSGEFKLYKGLRLANMTVDSATAVKGEVAYRSDINQFRGYRNTTWLNFLMGSDAILNQNASAQLGATFFIDSTAQVGKAGGNTSMGINAAPSATSALVIRQKSSSSLNPVLALQETGGTVVMDFVATSSGGQIRSKDFNLATQANRAFIRVTPANNTAAENIIRLHSLEDITKAGGSLALVSIGTLQGATPIGKFSPSSGKASLTSLLLDPTIEQTGSANGDIYGLRYNPTVTSLMGLHYGLYINSGLNYFADKVLVGYTSSQGDYIAQFNGGILVGNKSTAPNGLNGGLFYNSVTNQFSGYQNGAWKNFLMEGDLSNNTNNTWLLGGNTGIVPTTQYIGTTDAQPLVFKTNNTEAFRVSTSGQVSIGTSVTPAGYKLAVAGNVIAEKVKVQLQTNWADYVFEPTYKLPSLTEIEAFIKANKHLPDVPSAKEVEEKGVDLGDNQAVLLKKIEELTLYIIEQDKKHDALLKKVVEMEAEIKRLEQK